MIFDRNIFDPNLFQTDPASDGRSTVVERKKGRSRSGRSRGFKWANLDKRLTVVNAFETTATMDIKAFRPASINESLIVESIRLDELDVDDLIAEAKEQLVSAASKTVDMKTLKKTIEVVSMKPKRAGLSTDSNSLLTAARELVESAKQLLSDKPIIDDEDEPEEEMAEESFRCS